MTEGGNETSRLIDITQTHCEESYLCLEIRTLINRFSNMLSPMETEALMLVEKHHREKITAIGVVLTEISKQDEGEK